MYVKKWGNRNRLDALIKNLQEADNSWVEVGYFSDQLGHPTKRTDLTFPELMAIHELRQDGLARPVLTIGYKEEQRNFEKDLEKNIKGFLYWGATGRRVSIRKYLDNVATFQVKRLRKYFGSTAALKSNSSDVIRKKGSNTPMVETGTLRDYLSYKTSSNPRTTTPM